MLQSEKLSDVKNDYYQLGLSVREIAAKNNVSIDAAYYFFRRHCLKRRGSAENNFLRFEKKQPSFLIKKALSANLLKLKIAGTMLYWAEGSKWSGEKIVDFANSDPQMISLFMSFLREVCGIDDSKIRIYLYCHSNYNSQELIDYWSDITKIPKQQFTKPYIKESITNSKQNKMFHGLIHVRYNDKKLLILIRQWIKEYTKI